MGVALDADEEGVELRPAAGDWCAGADARCLEAVPSRMPATEAGRSPSEQSPEGDRGCKLEAAKDGTAEGLGAASNTPVLDRRCTCHAGAWAGGDA